MAEDAFEELSRRLAVLVAKLDQTYDELLEANRAQREFNRQQVEINADVKTTLVRIEMLIARMLPTGENGREA
jgi:hypothetical protein